MTDHQQEKIIIGGSSPARYPAAIHAARAGLTRRVIVGPVTAGSALMDTTDVEDFPCFTDGIREPERMGNLRQQAERYLAALEDAPSIATAPNEENVHV